jgi:DHA2 family multidrug resistance protein
MAFSAVARPKMGNATGLMNLARNIGGSSGIAIVTTTLARRQQFHQHSLVAHLTPFDAGYAQALGGTAHALPTQGASPSQAMAQAQAILYGMVQRQSMMKAFIDNFWMLGIIFLAIVPLMFFMKRVTPHKGAVIME